MKNWKLTGIALCSMVLFSSVASSKARARKNEFSAEALKILQQAETMEVLALDPNQQRERSEKPDTEEKAAAENDFHGWKILGRTKVTDGAIRKEVVTSLLKGMQEIDVGAKCFIPRHGLRVTAGDESVDMVICFQCSRLSAYVNKNPKDEYLLVDGTAAPALNKILKKVGISLAK